MNRPTEIKCIKANKTAWIKKTIFVTSALIALPTSAFATTEVGRIIGAACDWLSGEVGASIAVLAVIYTGYEMISGEIDKKKFAIRCVAIGMIVGGAYITTNILGVS